jgi:hypothetical protein
VWSEVAYNPNRWYKKHGSRKRPSNHNGINWCMTIWNSGICNY